MDPDLELSVTLLTEGFIALCDEYKALAAQHQSIERRLALSQQECDRLRQLCPEEVVSSIPQDPSETQVKTSLPLSEWLDNIRRTDHTDHSDSVTRIKQAESACVQISNRLAGTKGGCPFNVVPRRQSQLPAHLSKSQYTPSLNTIPDMEEDFTTPGAKSGTLNCPFAVMATSAENKKDRMPPTPHSSRSQSRLSQSRLSQSSKPRAKRASFHDPLNPSVIVSSEGSRANSIAGSGPACPIRFLGQHSPEEIAKYFQEHKHELPRSHEVCVKRFQENSDDIRKLDAKYGSLVNMIQGLGQKHRPMLPTVPVFDEDDDEGQDDEYDEARDREKIAKWAKSVSVVGAESGDPALKHRRTSDPTAQTGGEERVSHFDRPLREVRVGESPSRPWGVPIPLKYHEREDDTGSTKADTPATTSLPAPAINVQETLDDTKPDRVTSKPKGKCPFDHKAMMASSAAATSKGLDPPELPVPKIEHTSSIVARPRTYAAQTPAAATAAGEQVEASKDQSITNNGFIVVSDGAHLRDLHLVNNGTLLIGLDAASARGLMQQSKPAT